MIEWLAALTWPPAWWCLMFHTKHHRTLARDKYAHHILCTRCLEYRENPK